MNKNLRDGLDLIVGYLKVREETLYTLWAKNEHHEQKKKYYEKVLLSAQGKGKTVCGIILASVATFMLLIINFAAISPAIKANGMNSSTLLGIIMGAGPFLIGFVIMFFIGMRLITSRKARKKQVEERAQKIWDEEVVPAKEDFDNYVVESHSIIDPLDEIYQEFTAEILPPSYRTYSDALALYDLVANGRADTMKEAVNLYESIKREEQRKAEFERALSTYEYRTQEIITNQHATNMQLSRLRDEIKRNS